MDQIDSWPGDQLGGCIIAGKGGKVRPLYYARLFRTPPGTVSGGVGVEVCLAGSVPGWVSGGVVHLWRLRSGRFYRFSSGPKWGRVPAFVFVESASVAFLIGYSAGFCRLFSIYSLNIYVGFDLFLVIKVNGNGWIFVFL